MKRFRYSTQKAAPHALAEQGWESGGLKGFSRLFSLMMLTNNLWSQSETERPQKWAICVWSLSSKSSFSKCVLSTYHMLETWEDLLKERTIGLGIFLNPRMDVRSSGDVAPLPILGPLGTEGLSVLSSGSATETFIKLNHVWSVLSFVSFLDRSPPYFFPLVVWKLHALFILVATFKILLHMFIWNMELITISIFLLKNTRNLECFISALRQLG